MKKLSIEEKAKRYDEAIEKLRDFYRDYDTVSLLINVKEELANIFPELKESEDERIRKGLLGYLHTLPNHFSHNGSLVTEWISWLEKQKEFVSADFDDVWETADCNKLTDPLNKYSKDAIKKMCHAWYDKGIELERRNWLDKQGEQKKCKDEHEPDWSEKDEEMFKYTINLLNYNLGCRKWIKSLKFRLLSPLIREFDKEEGSIIDHLIAICDDAICYKTFAGCYDIEKCKTFLTNLKFGIQTQPQNTWKPSKEHISWLIWVINRVPNEAESVLRDLLEHLNKLRDE